MINFLTLWLIQQASQDLFLPQTLNDWLSTFAVIFSAAGVAGGAVWAFNKRYVKQAVDAECRDRKTADTNIDTKVMDHAQKIHVLMGKVEVHETMATRSEMDRNQLHTAVGKMEGEVTQIAKMFHEAELARVREIGDLRVMVAEGFASLKAKLDAEADRRREGDK